MAAVAFIAFLCAASVGLFMAWNHKQGRTSPAWWGAIHGVFVLVGFLALIGEVFVTPEEGRFAGWHLLVLFLLTASGGAYLLSRQLKDEPWPGLVLVAHGGAALASIVALGIWMF
jgi:hypothetical protein